MKQHLAVSLGRLSYGRSAGLFQGAKALTCWDVLQTFSASLRFGPSAALGWAAKLLLLLLLQGCVYA